MAKRHKIRAAELPLELSDKKPVILFRDAEYSASYCKEVTVIHKTF